MKCDPRFFGEKYKCLYCGREDSKETLENNHCPFRIESHEPSPLQKIVNFIPAITIHTVDGFKEVTQEEIDRRFKICQECPLYKKLGEDSGICTHRSCGCNVGQEKKFLNKLAWASERCPINKW